MKCPVCFATQDTIPGEIIHVCPYCDAILIKIEGTYRTVDKFPWWIKKDYSEENYTGLIVTDKNRLIFKYEGKWLLNGKYEKSYDKIEKSEYSEIVKYIYGSIPVFAYPGTGLKVEFGENIKIYHPKGLTVFKPV